MITVVVALRSDAPARGRRLHPVASPPSFLPPSRLSASPPRTHAPPQLLRRRLEVLGLPGQPAMGAVTLPAKAVRAPDGRRIGIALTDAEATLTLTDDLAALEAALAGRGLAAGPFPREQVLALLADLLGGTDG